MIILLHIKVKQVKLTRYSKGDTILCSKLGEDYRDFSRRNRYCANPSAFRGCHYWLTFVA